MVLQTPKTEARPPRAAPRKPPRPTRLADTQAEPCASCGLVQAHRVRLAHQGSEATMTICLRCLRSSMQMKSDLSESRGPFVLREYAEAFGWQVWTTSEVAYLLPSVAPFTGPVTPAIKPGA